MRNICFLIVDDSAIVLNKVRKVIENKFGSKHIVEASDGAVALRALEKSNIEIIISDWNMPNLSGEELLYEVRNNDKWKHIPFIMMSANSNRDFIVTAIQNGVTNYVVKPFTPAELEDKIKRSWNSTNRRKAERFSLLLEHKLIVKLNDKIIPAQVVDISNTGALIRLEHVEGLQLFKEYELILEAKGVDSDGIHIITDLYGMAVRLEVESCFYPFSSMCLMALSFIPNMMSREVESRLNALLKKLSASKPNIIGNE